ncbi:hypothetical protein MNBD_GAMMA12-1040 [hydrothermal vent metagenome]|uniref:PilZ domain-containing protein n=1 Tax=hydrothermal vent metagenome TaxID=652676 RepID=A0A3B0Z1T7_9ZZZZ
METASKNIRDIASNNSNNPKHKHLPLEHRGLFIPERHAIMGNSPSLKPRTINQWLDNLPLANETQTAISLTTFIHQTNHIAYSLAKRFKALEVLQPTIQRVLRHLKNSPYNHQWPLTKRIQQQLAITTSLLESVSIGYQICVVDLLTQTANPSRRALATCLQRSLQALGEILLSTYHKYSAPTPTIWYSIHQLYLIARSFSCKDRSVKNIEPLTPAYSSVAFEYKKQILLKLANPTRLLNSQVTDLETQAEIWAHDLELEIISDDTSSSMFVIDPLSDSSPMRYDLALQNTLDPLYVIPLDTLIKRLLGILQAGKSGIKIPAVSGVSPTGTLIKLLLTNWLQKEKRTYKRTQQQVNLQATIGLLNSFNFVSQNNRLSNQKSTSTTLMLMDKNDYPLTSLAQSSFYGEITNNDSLDQPLGASQASEKIHLHHCKVLNVSANGYCLQRKDKIPTNIQIGDIIALYEPDNIHSPQSSIGVVRWLHYEASTGITFGVQVLSPMAQALRTAFTKNGHNTLLPGLGLPKIPALQQPASLLTSAQRYNIGDHIQINKGRQKINITLSERIECHQGFDRFKYKIQID